MELRVGNRYRLGRKIGSGSFGDIYLGEARRHRAPGSRAGRVSRRAGGRGSRRGRGLRQGRRGRSAALGPRSPRARTPGRGRHQRPPCERGRGAGRGGLRRGGGEGSGERVGGDPGTVGVERRESLGSGRGPGRWGAGSGGGGSGARRAVVGCRRAWEKDGGSGRGAVLELGQGAAGPWGGGGESGAWGGGGGQRAGGGAPKKAGPGLRGPASAASPPPKVTAVNKGHALCSSEAPVLPLTPAGSSCVFGCVGEKCQNNRKGSVEVGSVPAPKRGGDGPVSAGSSGVSSELTCQRDRLCSHGCHLTPAQGWEGLS